MSTVRICGGLWRRTPLPVPQRPGLRPTPDRVRETLFNWLGQSLAGCRALDVFAGSGALGLEAASRGADEVEMIESDREAAAGIRGVLGRFGSATDPASRDAAARIRLRHGDALRELPRLAAEGRAFDLVLLDPPFGQGWIERVMPLLGPLLAPGARLYVESDARIDDGQLARWSAGIGHGARLERLREGRAGHVHYHLLIDRRTEADR